MKPVAALAMVVFAATAGAVTGASPASAQIVGMTATFAPIVPSPGRPGTTSTTSVTFTATQDLGPVQLDVIVGLGFGAIAIDATNTTAELTNCTADTFGATCEWDAQVADGPQTLAFTIGVPPNIPGPDTWPIVAFLVTGSGPQLLAETSLPIEPPLGSMALSGSVIATGGVLANACVFLLAATNVIPVVANEVGSWSATGLPDGTSFVIAVAPPFSGPGGPCQITGLPQPPGPGELQPEWVDNLWIDLADPDLINAFANPYEYAVAHGATVFSTSTSGIFTCLTATPGDVVPRPPCELVPATTAPPAATTTPSTTTPDPGTTTSPAAAPTSAAAGTLPATGGSGGSVPVAGMLALVAGAVLVVSQRRRRPLSGRQQSSRQGIER